MMVTGRRKPLRLRLLVYGALAFYVIIVLAPLYWMVLTSLRSQRQIYSREAMLAPRNLTLANYDYALTEKPLGVWLVNSLVVATSSAGIALVISSLAGYAIARLRFRGRNALARTLVYMYLVPASLLFIPMFVIMGRLNLLDTRLGLILAYQSFCVPFATWLLFGYFMTIPRELEDAARIDGCSYMGVLLRIVLPLAKPGIAATFIFSFTEAWNEFLYAAVMLSSQSLKTAPLGLTNFVIGDNYQWGPLTAAAVLTTIPTIILFMVTQRFIVQGLTGGAVKG